MQEPVGTRTTKTVVTTTTTLSNAVVKIGLVEAFYNYVLFFACYIMTDEGLGVTGFLELFKLGGSMSTWKWMMEGPNYKDSLLESKRMLIMIAERVDGGKKQAVRMVPDDEAAVFEMPTLDHVLDPEVCVIGVHRVRFIDKIHEKMQEIKDVGAALQKAMEPVARVCKY